MPDFQGRGAEIEKLCVALRDGGQAAISGMGGVGKSALAVHVAHLLEDAASDGRILVEMGGTSGKPLSPAEGMRKVIAGIDPERQVPKEEDAARQAYRVALDGKRVLLLLDNAEGSAQVRPLLDWRAPGTMVIVTSRRTLAAPGLKRIDLDVMPPDEARALLLSALGERTAGEDELDRIAERCGRLPLALRVAGTWLALNPNVSSARYLDALTDEKKRLAFLKIDDDATLDVFAVLGLSALELAHAKPELEARRRLLAVFPASFDTAAAAAVWEIGPDEAEQELGELRRRSMVLYGPADGRWRVHDLMRDLAQVSLESQDEAAVATRLEGARAHHARHYCNVLAAADDLYLKGGEGVLAGLALYDLEQRNIATGQAWAAARIEQDDANAQLAADYASNASELLSIRLHPRERIEWLNARLKACAKLNDRQGEGSTLTNLGIAWADLGEHRRAIDFYEQALEIAREINDQAGEANVLGGLANVYRYLGEPLREIQHYEQQLAIRREIKHQRGEGITLGGLGNAWTGVGEPGRAIEFFEQQSQIARELGDRKSKGNAFGGRGNALLIMGEHQKALDSYNQQLHIARELRDQRGQAHALFGSALALYALGERAEAVRRARAALAIREAIGARHLVEQARAQLAAWGADDAPG